MLTDEKWFYIYMKKINPPLSDQDSFDKLREVLKNVYGKAHEL